MYLKAKFKNIIWPLPLSAMEIGVNGIYFHI